MIRIVALALVLGLSAVSAQAASACDMSRLEGDMRCCLGMTCAADRPGVASVKGAVQRPPTSQTLFNLRKGWQACQSDTAIRNNFYACERADSKGPYNLGRRLLGLPSQ